MNMMNNLLSVSGEVSGSLADQSVNPVVGSIVMVGAFTVDEEGHLMLTDLGKRTAEQMYERHTLLTQMLTMLGVDESVAAEDACRIEHVISKETFEAIKQYMANKK